MVHAYARTINLPIWDLWLLFYKYLWTKAVTMEKSELIKQNGGKTRKANHSAVFLYLNNAIHKLYYFLKVDFRLP